VLGVAAIGDQRIRDLLAQFWIGGRRTRRHGAEIGKRIVGAWRRRALLGDGAALQAMPPSHRIHRVRHGGATTQQPSHA